MPNAAGEIILSMPTPVVPARHMRSTLLIASINTLRTLGRFDDYAAHLSPEHKEMLLTAIAGTWVPMDVAMAHYDACETLGLPIDQQVANGRVVFDKTSGTLLGTAIRMAREAGITPWSVFPYFQRFWERGYDGGGLAVYKAGPKEAVFEVVSVRLLESRYFRNALRGLTGAMTELFCRKAYVTEKPGQRAPSSVTVRVQWA